MLRSLSSRLVPLASTPAVGAGYVPTRTMAVEAGAAAGMTKLIAAVGGAAVAVGGYYWWNAGKNDGVDDGSWRPRIIIFGAPASGKGTQCRNICNEWGVQHVSTGDLFRKNVKENTPIGQKAKAYMDRGDLVPHEIVHAMADDVLKSTSVKNTGWVLDGLPREPANSDFLIANGHVPDVFLVLDVDEDKLVERVVGRRKDPVTGEIYHIKYAPPKSPEVAARLVQRKDDTEEVAKKRIRVYNERRESSLAPFDDALIVHIDGNQSKDAVFAEIKEKVDAMLGPEKLKIVADLKAKRAAATA